MTGHRDGADMDGRQVADAATSPDGGAAADGREPAKDPVPAYPMMLAMAGRRAVVVGGGRVALRRTIGLLEAGANVVVIAPQVRADLAALQVTVLRRGYRDGDLSAAWLAHATTDDPAVNDRVAAEAERNRIWCVRADDGAVSAARTPAVTRHGDLQVAVTAGRDPRRAQRLRSAIALALADGRLPVRPHRRSGGTGHVALVGGGPGDPGLITVLGRRLLAEADVVVTDKLAPRELLAELDPDVEIIDAGKQPHAHNLSQAADQRADRGQGAGRTTGGTPQGR